MSLRALLSEKRVIICVGSGGVGKTTTSAVIALEAAIRGQKVLVLTVDPAKRLANCLGVDALGDRATEVGLTELQHDASGSLFAMMLDMKQAFDRLIVNNAPDEATRDKILNNRFYRYFSTSLAGTQEYSAMERLYQLYDPNLYTAPSPDMAKPDPAVNAQLLRQSYTPHRAMI